MAAQFDLDAAARAVAEACVAFQSATDPAERAAAERVLLDFRRADGAVALGLGVLARTSLPAAQFHALGAIRDGVPREWAALGAEARAQLEQAVVGLLGSAELDHAVQAKACELLAAVAKHDAIDALADGDGGGAATGGGASARLVAHASMLFQLQERQRLGALLLLSALVHEFGSPAESHGASAAAVPAALQQAARLAFQTRQLPALFDALVELLRAGIADDASPPDAPVLSRAVALLATVLGWDFVGTTGTVGTAAAAGAAASAGGGGGRPGLFAATVRPPAEWRGRVDSPALLAAAWELYRRLRALAEGRLSAVAGSAGSALQPGSARVRTLEDALHGSRQLLVQLASVHRGAFASDDAHTAHVLETVRALVGLCGAPLAPAALSGEDAAAAEAIDVPLLAARLLANSGAEALARLPDAEGRALYAALLSCACARFAALEAAADAAAAGGSDGEEEGDELDRAEGWLAEAADAHAELWISVLESHAPPQDAHAEAAPHPLAAHARQLFEASVRAALAVARAEGASDEEADAGTAAADDAARAERLLALAALGRADGSHAARLLCSVLAERTQRLRGLCAALGSPERAAAAAAGGGGPRALSLPTEAESRAIGSLLEELDLLVRLTAALVADGAHGEAPTVPHALAALPCAAPEEHAVSHLLAALLALVGTQDALILAAARAHASHAAARAEAAGWRRGAGGDAGAAAGDGLGAGGMSGGALSAALSPRLAESLLWALERIAQTYLLGAAGPEPVGAAAAGAAGGAGAASIGRHWAVGSAAGSALLAACVESAALRLLCWPGDDELAAQACRLLRSLARAPRAAAELGAQPAWARVLAAHAPGSRALAHVPAKSQRLLLEALACAGGASGSAEAARAYFGELCGVLGARLGAALGGGHGGGGAARGGGGGGGGDCLTEPAAQLALGALCQSARGLSRAVPRLAWAPSIEPPARALLRAELLAFCAQLAGQLGPALLPRFAAGAAPQLATAVLRVQADCARAAAQELGSALGSAEAMAGPLACAWELAALGQSTAAAYVQHYGSSSGGANGQGAQPSAADEAEEDARCAQLIAQLRTLMHIAAALADGMACAAEAGGADGVRMGAGGENARAAASVSDGFCRLLPMLTARALAVPKLCVAFFEALAAVLALARAPGAPALSPALAHAARGSLRHGSRHGSAEVSRLALEATYELAAHAAQHAPPPEAVSALVRGLQHELLLDLVGSQILPDLVDPAAGSALLALIVAQPEGWAQLAQAVAARAPEPDVLRALFAQLTTANGVRCSLDRPNRARFRANLARFLPAVRQRPHLATVMSTAAES